MTGVDVATLQDRGDGRRHGGRIFGRHMNGRTGGRGQRHRHRGCDRLIHSRGRRGARTRILRRLFESQCSQCSFERRRHIVQQ